MQLPGRTTTSSRTGFLKQQLGGKLQLKRGEMSHLAITTEAIYVIYFTYSVVLHFHYCTAVWALVARDCNGTQVPRPCAVSGNNSFHLVIQIAKAEGLPCRRPRSIPLSCSRRRRLAGGQGCDTAPCINPMIQIHVGGVISL
jgi:hypothetical protein